MTNCLFNRQAPSRPERGVADCGASQEYSEYRGGTLVDDLFSLELQPDDVNNHEHGGYSCGDRSLLAEKG